MFNSRKEENYIMKSIGYMGAGIKVSSSYPVNAGVVFNAFIQVFPLKNRFPFKKVGVP